MASFDLTTHKGNPTTVAKALVDCQRIVIIDQLAEAARQAKQRGILRKSEANIVMAILVAPARPNGERQPTFGR